MPQKSAQLVMITLPPMSLKRQSFLENNKALASEYRISGDLFSIIVLVFW
jgi:hypothetical protein